MFRYIKNNLADKFIFFLLIIIFIIVATGLTMVMPLIFGEVIDKIISMNLYNEDLTKFLIIIIITRIFILFFDYLANYLIITISNGTISKLRLTIFKDVQKPDTNFYYNDKYINNLMTIEQNLREIKNFLTIHLITILKMSSIMLISLIILLILNLTISLYSLIPLLLLVINQYLNYNEKKSITALNSIFSILAFLLPLTITLIFGTWQALNDIITIGNFFSYAIYLAFFTIALIKLNKAYLKSKSCIKSMHNINAIFAEEKINKQNKESIKINKIYGNINFNNLSFIYKDDIIPILKQINFNIKSGEKIVIMGEKNAGKSSIISLILGFQQASRNTILIDGIDILDIDKKSLRARIGYLPEKAFLFEDSLKNNIILGEQEYKDKKIIHYGKLVGIDQKIKLLAKAYDSVYNQHLKFSESEKQAICLARILIKNPDLIILDEALQELKKDTFYNPLANLKEELKDTTCIIASNDLQIAREADLIIFLKNGYIIESGNHLSLLNRKGEYYKLTQEHQKKYKYSLLEEIIS